MRTNMNRLKFDRPFDMCIIISLSSYIRESKYLGLLYSGEVTICCSCGVLNLPRIGVK